MANYLFNNCLSGTTCLLQKYKINEFKSVGISLVTTYTGNVNGNDILYLGGYLYTVILSANTISKFDLNLNLITSVNTESGTTYMCDDGTYIYACTNTTTYKFDTDLNFQTSATTINWKYGLYVSGYLYVLNGYTIYKYDAITLTLVDSVAYGTASYTAMALTTDNTYLYVGGKLNTGYGGLLNKYDFPTILLMQ